MYNCLFSLCLPFIALCIARVASSKWGLEAFVGYGYGNEIYAEVRVCQPKDFDRLRPIHVAGTKGKGSTSALISSILMQYVNGASAMASITTSSSSASSLPTSPKVEPEHGTAADTRSALKPRKVGLYTSPHLRSVRERIQINNEPLSESAFAKYFFEIWDRLEDAARAKGEDPSATSVKPMYFRYLTLMALHAYMVEGVDSAVIECGIGGEYDATNILVQPTVTAITSLGIDHVEILGSTLRDIAWHKAGIFKSGAHALSVPQPPEALEVLRARASERGVDLHVIERSPEVDALKLGLAADFQKTNASLAVAVVAAHLGELGYRWADQLPRVSSGGCSGDGDAVGVVKPSPLPAEFRRGLERVRLAGRCDIRRESDKLTWYIDGGHTMDSIRIAGEWYASCAKPAVRKQALGCDTADPSTSNTVTTNPRQNRILIFNQQSRDALALARTLFATLANGFLNKNVKASTNTTVSTDPTALLPPTSIDNSNKNNNTTTDNTTVNNDVNNKNKNCNSRNNDNIKDMKTTHPANNPITHAFFCTNVTFSKNGYKPDLVSINADADAVQALSVQHALARLWKELDPACDVRVFGTVEEVVAGVRELVGGGGEGADRHGEGDSEGDPEDGGDGGDVADVGANMPTEAFVTGSLHLVGGVLEVLEGVEGGVGVGVGVGSGAGAGVGAKIDANTDAKAEAKTDASASTR